MVSFFKPFYKVTKTFLYESNPEKRPYQVHLLKGHYIFECYGASGGTNGSEKFIARGAYTSAYAYIDKSIDLYIYVGGKGTDTNMDMKIAPGGYNGGGNGGSSIEKYISGAGGGGATDIRLIRDGTDNHQQSLESRIMVAGGGGGFGHRFIGGHGGKQKGLCSQCDVESNLRPYCGGTESDNNFGYGLDGANVDKYYNYGSEGKGGGGGGWYGGLASQKTGEFSNAAGGGGSSYISGDIGFSENPSFHFKHAYILSGEESNYIGDGIAFISKLNELTFSKKISINHLFLYPFII